MLSVVDIRKLASTYGFDDIYNFSVWVEKEGLYEALETVFTGSRKSRRLKSRCIALEILARKDVQDFIKEHPNESITLRKWLEWSREVMEIGNEED